MDELNNEDLALARGGNLVDANGNPVVVGPGPSAGQILEGIQNELGNAIDSYFDAAADFINWVESAAGGGYMA